jgi:hypothetical protein
LTPSSVGCGSLQINAIQSFDDVITVVGGSGRYQLRLFLVTQFGYFAVTGSLLQV